MLDGIINCFPINIMIHPSLHDGPTASLFLNKCSGAKHRGLHKV
jgi:hypothetical protein